MKQYSIRNRWKKTGILLLTGAALGIMPGGACGSASALSQLAGSTRLTAYGAEALPEYDEETLKKLADNTLEYWEIPGLIDQYNAEYRNQLETYYSNPGGSTGLSRDQMLKLAADLREEAGLLSREAEDEKDSQSISDQVYEEYQTNIKELKKYASDLEKAANGDSAAGTAAFRGLRLTREKKTKEISAQMRDHQALVSQLNIAKKNQEIAEGNLESARRQQSLGLYSVENVLASQEALNTARAACLTASSAEQDARQQLISALGWGYDAQPEILPVPEPDLERFAAMDPEVDVIKALENNQTLYETRRKDSSAQGGADKKARNIQSQEDQVRMAFNQVYQTVCQAERSYTAALTEYQAAQADWEAAQRKNSMGMLSRNEYLAAEAEWLTAEASKESAGLAFTAAMEDYDWAMKGMLAI